MSCQVCFGFVLNCKACKFARNLSAASIKKLIIEEEEFLFRDDEPVYKVKDQRIKQRANESQRRFKTAKPGGDKKGFGKFTPNSKSRISHLEEQRYLSIFDTDEFEQQEEEREYEMQMEAYIKFEEMMDWLDAMDDESDWD